MAGEQTNSTINLYKTELNETKNAYIDDLEDYLASCSVTEEIDDFQYIRHDLNVSIKIDKDQSFVNDFNYNYVKIVNAVTSVNENFTGYYFIKKTTQVSPKTIQLDLKLDTINSLGQKATDGCNPRNFLSKTRISRQHKNRYYKPDSWHPENISVSNPEILNRNIDRLPEGITFTPHKISDTKLLQHERDIDWYLIYTSNADFDKEYPEDIIPIKIYLTTGNGSIGYKDPETQTTKVLRTKEELDITNARINTVICLPYCPIDHSVSTAGIFDFGQYWKTETESDFYLNGYLRYDGPATKIMPEFINEDVASIDLGPSLSKLFITRPTYQDDKNMLNESKLNHSDYNYYKATYDSFSKVFKPEDFVIDKHTYNYDISIDYKQTNTANSTMLFDFDYSNFNSVYTEEDFNNILVVNRNNEETLLNSNYLNYLRNGYNYDRKARDIQLEQSWRNLQWKTIDTGIDSVQSMAKGFATGGGAGFANAWVDSMQSVGHIYQEGWNLVDQSKLQNLSLASKINDLANQKISIAGADDVDLMKYYSGNKLHKILYRIDEYYLAHLYRLFDLTGYVINNYATPSVDTRIWYNYIACSPELDFDTTKGYKNSWLEDLKNKYNIGVTVYHNNVINDDKTWNLNQDYENWEKWIVEGVN